MRKTFSNVLMKLGLVLIAIATVTGCASVTSGSATDAAYCRAFRPITWAAADTDGTLRQVKAHNAVGVSLCKWAAR